MFAKRLKQARLDKKLTQEQLAKMVNTKKSTISNYENEYSSPSNEMLYDLANVLEVTSDYLLGRVDFPQGFKADYSKPENEVSDDNYRKIERFARNLTPKDRRKALRILEATFEDAFDEDDDDDDDL